jgi:CheY-like chemotaxis protein
MAFENVSRVIVADDVRDSADTIAELLSGQGLEARAVYDGHEAIRVAEAWEPDGAVLDLGLPGLSGYEVARELRRRYGRKPRLVAYTGWAGDADRERALEAGFDGYLVKPADPPTIFLALGLSTVGLVGRSIDARVVQLERQIALGDSLLRHGAARPEALDVICIFLLRAFDACKQTLPDLPVSDSERRRLGASLDDVVGRIAQAKAQRHK